MSKLTRFKSESIDVTFSKGAYGLCIFVVIDNSYDNFFGFCWVRLSYNARNIHGLTPAKTGNHDCNHLSGNWLFHQINMQPISLGR